MQKALQRFAVQGGPASIERTERKEVPFWVQMVLMGATGGVVIGMLIGVGLAGVV